MQIWGKCIHQRRQGCPFRACQLIETCFFIHEQKAKMSSRTDADTNKESSAAITSFICLITDNNYNDNVTFCTASLLFSQGKNLHSGKERLQKPLTCGSRNRQVHFLPSSG